MFQIMQGTPAYRPDEAPAEEAIAGQEGTLLRLLILRRGQPLTKEDIARHLTRSGKHSVEPSSVPGYVGRLRARIGQDRIRSTAGYTSGIDGADVDAFVFENAIKQYGVNEVTDVDEADGLSASYEDLLDLHAMWKANPALPFADGYDDEFLVSTYLRFENYWECLKRSIIYTELRSRRKPRIERAIGRIEQLLRQDPADEQLWALLVRARASLPGRETAIASLSARIRAQFPHGVPSELRYAIDRIEKGYDDALFEIDRHPRVHEDQQRINALVQEIGISWASELELRGSRLEPLECISQTVSRLRFSGILATKWVADSYVRAQFDRLLEKLDNTDGSVRFLLIDPDSDGYRRFSDLRWSAGGIESISILRDLSAAHRSFEIRLYGSLPAFRVVLIDQSVVSFSPYLMEPGTHRAKSGWQAPHVILDRTAAWPLAHTFETLFDENWRTATPLLLSGSKPRLSPE
jgi:DNA-binding SARP family transcriptional activator